MAFYLSLYSIINMTSSGEYFYSLTFEMKLIIRVVNSQKKKRLKFNNIIKGFNIIKDATSKLLEISW